MTTPSGLARPRSAYIDWLRGLAVIFMILWHVVDAWHVSGSRDTATFAAVIFFAGWAAPMFLFLAGVSLPMAGMARMARGHTRRDAARALVWRGWQVLGLAHLFRLQSFLLNPHASWNSLFKPDILNVLGLGLVMAAFVWGRAESSRQRIVWLLGPALLVAGLLTPWAPYWWWPSLLHPRLEGYIRIVDGNAVFSLFPAVAYVLVGAFHGSQLVEAPHRSEARVHRQAFRVGMGLLVVTIAATALALPLAVEEWTGHLLIVALRTGAMLVMLACAWRWLRSRALDAPGPMGVLGRTSLLVYWIHVELAYGNVSYPLHRALTLQWTLAGCALMVLGMYVGARWWVGRRRGEAIVPAHMAAGAPVG